MKKFIKSRLFIFILGAIIFGGIGVIAYTYNASQITYSPSDNSWDVHNVGEAIDDLKEKEVLNKLTVSFGAFAWNNYSQGWLNISKNSIYNNYKYFKIDKIERGTQYTDLCEAKMWNGTDLSAEIGKKYLVNSNEDNSNISHVFAVAGTNTSGQMAKCWVYVTFYN